MRLKVRQLPNTCNIPHINARTAALSKAEGLKSSDVQEVFFGNVISAKLVPILLFSGNEDAIETHVLTHDIFGIVSDRILLGSAPSVPGSRNRLSAPR